MFHHPTMRQRIARERHDERIRDAERRAHVAAAMRDRHEPAPWPVVPDHVPAHWTREPAPADPRRATPSIADRKDS